MGKTWGGNSTRAGVVDSSLLLQTEPALPSLSPDTNAAVRPFTLANQSVHGWCVHARERVFLTNLTSEVCLLQTAGWRDEMVTKGK